MGFRQAVRSSIFHPERLQPPRALFPSSGRRPHDTNSHRLLLSPDAVCRERRLRQQRCQDQVDDTIQPISAEYVDRAIEHARQTNADAVLD